MSSKSLQALRMPNVDDGFAIAQARQECLGKCRCADNIGQKDMLHVFHIPASDMSYLSQENYLRTIQPWAV